MPEVAQTEIAWAAGFFDGEGTITAAPNRTGPKLYTRMAVTQSDRRPLDRFTQSVGVGRVYALKRRRGLRQEFSWSIASRSGVAHVVDLLWPYLSEPKREQIIEVQGREQRRVAATGQATIAEVGQ